MGVVTLGQRQRACEGACVATWVGAHVRQWAWKERGHGTGKEAGEVCVKRGRHQQKCPDTEQLSGTDQPLISPSTCADRPSTHSKGTVFWARACKG